MRRLRLSPDAAQDLSEIYEYIAQDSVDTAEGVRTGIYDALRGLVMMPGRGHRREDLTTQPVLFWPVQPYQIVYLPQSNPLQIVAVLHGKRNIRKILKQR